MKKTSISHKLSSLPSNKKFGGRPKRIAPLIAIFPIERVFRCPRVYLRRLDRSLAESYRSLLDRNRLWLQPWMPEIPYPLTLGDVRKFIENEHLDLRRAQRVDLGVFNAINEELIGRVVLHSIQWGVAFSAGLGYWIDAEFAGKGLMTEAVARLVSTAFEEIGLHRVWASVQPANRPSQRVLEKLGFVRESLHRKELFINGQWQDQFFFTMLETEFWATRAKWVVNGWLGE